MTVTVLHGDMREVLKGIEGAPFASCVCDPPYHLTNNKGTRSPYPGQYTPIGKPKQPKGGFMGKQWDGGDIAFQPETWAAVGAVLRPGAHLVAFAGTKGFHRMICAIEDAGFEIRDTIMWLYGSGFPKSHNQHGDWEGWGTALKPAYEPIVLARWPMAAKTVAGNLAEHGAGAINIDGCRVDGPMDGVWGTSNATVSRGRMFNGSPDMDGYRSKPHDKGRWPANVVHDGSEEVVRAFPSPHGAGSQREEPGGGKFDGKSSTVAMGIGAGVKGFRLGDEGSAARFFYSAKADADDRLGSKHPTVKPVDLMRWLIRLVTPKGGHILDPFAGSGSTGMAAMAEGFDATLIEREAEYVADIERRIAHVSGSDAPLFSDAGRDRRGSEPSDGERVATPNLAHTQ